MKSTLQNSSKTVAGFVAAAALTLLSALPTGATVLYWDGGVSNIAANGDGVSQGTAGSWDTATQNWDQGAGLPEIIWDNSQNYDAYFGASGIAVGAGVVTLNAPITANSLSVVTTNYIFTDAGNSANTLTVNFVTNTVSTTISNNVINGGTFEKDGGGTLTLMAPSSSFTAAVNVNAGTLTFGNQAAPGLTGPTAFGNVTVAPTATFKLAVNASSTYSQTIDGGGSFFVQGSNFATVVTIAGGNTFSGNVQIASGALQATSISDSAGNSLGLGTNVIIGNNSSSASLNYAGYGDTTSRTLTLGGTTATVGNTLNANGFGPLVWTGPLAFSGTNTHTFSLSGTYSGVNIFAGAITDGVVSNTVVAKSGAGLWMLTGSNSYSGGTTLSGGTLLITNDYALGNPTGRVFCSSSTTLKSTNNSVILGIGRPVITTNATLSFGVADTNNLTVPSFITGPGAVTKSGSSFSLGTVRFSNDTNNFTGTFTASFGNTEFTSVANSGTPSSLGSGITNAGTIVLANSASSGTLRYVGANNSSTTRALNWTATTGGYSLDASGAGTIAYLNATSNLVSGAGAKTLNLQGSNTGTNTLAEVVNDSTGGITTLTKSGSGKWVLTGVNTFSGTATISGGTLSIGSDANLGTAPGSATPNALTINGGTLSASASFTLNPNRGLALGPTGNVTNGVGTIDVASGQTLTYAGIMADSTTTNNGGLVKTSAGKLVLSGVNTYTGDTTVGGGTLALSGSGSIATSTNVVVNAGATLDVSGVSGGYILVSGQSLVATNGAVATVNGSLDVASAAVLMTNVVNTPTITVTGGALTLGSGTLFTVNNGSSPLTAGSYKLISKGTGGSVAGTAPATVTVSGNGLATGAAAALNISGGELYLVVTGGTLYPPVISSLKSLAGQAVLSFTGTNGQTWKVLTSTNVALPLANWSIAATGTFNGSTVNYTNPSPVDPKRFYLITCP